MNTKLHFLSQHYLAYLVIATLSSLPVSAFAFNYQLHAFASQGLIFSQGNNELGNSTHGSVAFNEFGANGTAYLAPGLLFSAQGLLRDAGKTENDSLRLDYALLDYQFVNTSDLTLGGRIGRVKNPFGLFNETRDVVFTRPGILLPSTYLDGQGFRSLLFASNGIQFYGHDIYGDHDISLTVSAGLNTKLDDIQKRGLFGGQSPPADIEVRNFHLGRLQDEIDGGVWRFAFSYLHGNLVILPQPGVALNGSVNANLYVASLRYNGENFNLTSEYSLIATSGSSSMTGPLDSKGDGIYVQGDYLLTNEWSVMARYDLSFANRNDRNGRQYAAQTGGDRYSQFSHDATVGFKWLPDEHWGIWGEYHLIEGTSTVPVLDNIGRKLDDHWSAFLLMIGYRY